MEKSSLGEMQESLFLWSSGGIRRVRKRLEEIVDDYTYKAKDTDNEDIEGIDKRRYPRLDLKFPILYKIIGNESSNIPSNVQSFLKAENTNISTNGICLSLGEEVGIGTIMALSLHFVEKRERLDALGRVVWCKPSHQSGCFLVGLEFAFVDKVNEA